MRRGTSVAADKQTNCGTCVLRQSCKDDRKSRKFACTFHTQIDESNPSDLRWAKYLNTLAKSESIIADKWQIDDGDAPKAPNFYKWCVGKEYLNAKPTPYPKQIQLGLKLFNDICVYCSPDKSWIDDIPYDCDVREIPRRLHLLRNGVCPHCGKSRLDAIKSGRVPDYEDLVCVVGQRAGKCLIGSTLVKTTRGLKRIKDITTADRICLYNENYAVSKAWRNGKKSVITLHTSLGYKITGTLDHLVKSISKDVPLSKCSVVKLDIAEGAYPSLADYRAWQLEGTIAKAEKKAKEKPKKLIDLLILLPKPLLVDKIKSLVKDEYWANDVLHLDFKSGTSAQAVHTMLLHMGMPTTLTEDMIRVAANSLRKYAKTVGVKDDHKAKSIQLALGRIDSTISPHLFPLLLERFDKAPLKELSLLDDLFFGEAKIVWQETRQKLKSQTLRISDVHSILSVLKTVPTTDKIEIAALIEMFKATIDPTCTYDAVNYTERHSPDLVYDIEVPEKSYFIANGMQVHNSTSIGLLDSYQTHLLLKLKNPSSFYSIKQGQILYSTIVGITYGGAKTNVWDPMLATIQDSPWYQTYHEILDDAAAKRGEEELYRMKDTFLYYRNCGLYLAPASPSRRTLRGKTRVGSVVDELAHFSSNAKLVNISGIEVWNALARSMQTVRLAVYEMRRKGIVDIPPALNIAISSPYEVTDPIMTLYNKPTSKTYAVLLPTWEFNPKMTFDFLSPEFDRDPVAAWRDYGARPPYSAKSFVASIDPFYEVVDSKAKPCVTQKTYTIKTRNRETTAVELKWNWTDISVSRVLAIDAGAVLNAFSFALGHIGLANEIVYDAFLEIRPTPDRPVSFRSAYTDVIKEVIEKMNVKVLVSDRWQNRKILEDAHAETSVITVEHRLKYGELLSWREELFEGKWRMPKPELKSQQILYPEDGENTFKDKPTANFIYESLRVVDVPGKKVEKPSEGNDDVFRAGALLHAALRRQDIAEFVKKGEAQKKSIVPIGVKAGSFGRVAGTQIVTNVAANIAARGKSVGSSIGVKAR